MNNLEEDINKMEFLLKSIYSDLKDFSINTYTEKISALTGKMNLVVVKREELKKKYHRKELLKYEAKLLILTKLIQKKFDNVIEEYNAKLLEIAQSLVQIDNRKKLVNYLR